MSELIEKGKWVSFHYALVSETGEVVDGSRAGEPLPYIHGCKNIVPGLEKALEGHQIGDHFKVTIAPEDGYGEIDEDKIFDVERKSFSSLEPLAVGMNCQVEDEQGVLQLARMIELDDEYVTLDANHPFAGQVLQFDIEVMGLRDASPEELQKGQP